MKKMTMITTVKADKTEEDDDLKCDRTGRRTSLLDGRAAEWNASKNTP